MLSATGFQPQLLAPVCQLSSLWHSVRSLTSVTVSKKHRARDEGSELVVKGTLEDGHNLTDLKTELEQTFEELGLKDLTDGLRVNRIHESDLRPRVLQPFTVGSVSGGDISASSFYMNKTGFTESQLLSATYGKAVRIHFPKFGEVTQRLHAKYLPQSVYRQFHRGFKTKRSQVAQGFTVKGEDVLPRRQVLQKTLMLGKGKSEKKNDILQKMLADYADKPSVQEKIKLAFAEGYASKHPDAEQQSKPFHKSVMFRGTSTILTVVLTIYIVLSIFKFLLGGRVKMLSMSNGTFEPINPENINVTFNDVKGCDEAKQELEDVVQFLRQPEKFRSLGAKLPKGILLVGSPGLGKTLLARAVAGEAGVPFFQTSGSEFDEMFVGTGARRVRSLFEAAKMRAPCVIFIDEIDTVGAKRSNSQIHPYANQTINQFLAELDGFNQNEGIIVLGATNRRDQLDKALLRPGRFDVEVRVFPPDLKGRREMFELYMSKIKYDKNIDTGKLAQSTTGCTGADIENIVNQAALKAVLDGAKIVTKEHFEYARDKVFMGPAKKTKIPDKETNRMTAYHEAGHTIVAFFTKGANPLYKVTILPRGMSLGHTSFVPDKEQYNYSKTQLLALMDVAMGGRVAEELIFGSDMVTTGASSDFDNATGIATSMVKQYGMSDEVGVRVLKDGAGADGGTTFIKVNDLSPTMTDLVDKEIKRLLQESYERARTVLKGHQKELKTLAEALIKYETLDKEEVTLLMKGKKLNKPESSTAPKTSKQESEDKRASADQSHDSELTFCSTRGEGQ